jgi:hypothetical protein
LVKLQAEHATASGAPHFEQNRRPGRFSVPQPLQVIAGRGAPVGCTPGF